MRAAQATIIDPPPTGITLRKLGSLPRIEDMKSGVIKSSWPTRKPPAATLSPMLAEGMREQAISPIAVSRARYHLLHCKAELSETWLLLLR